MGNQGFQLEFTQNFVQPPKRKRSRFQLTLAFSPHSARNGSLKIFKTRQSGFQQFSRKLMIVIPISVSLFEVLR